LGSEFILRFEDSTRTNKQVEVLLGVDKPKLCDLCVGPLFIALRFSLCKLGLDKPSYSKSDILEVMRNIPKRTRSSLLEYILFAIKFPGLNSKELAQIMGVTDKTVNKYKRTLASYNIGDVYEGGSQELPPQNLEKPFGLDIEENIGSESVSNTCDRSGMTEGQSTSVMLVDPENMSINPVLDPSIRRLFYGSHLIEAATSEIEKIPSGFSKEAISRVFEFLNLIDGYS
jgi:hypothetical protein